MGQKCQYLAQNDKKCIFLTKFGFFGPKFLILAGGTKSFDTHLMENHLGSLFAEFIGRAWDQMFQKIQYLAKKLTLGQIWPFFELGTEMCFFWPKNLNILGSKSIFRWLLRFLSIGHITSITRAATFPFRPTQKNFFFRAMGHSPGLTPVFGRFGPVLLQKYKYP